MKICSVEVGTAYEAQKREHLDPEFELQGDRAAFFLWGQDASAKLRLAAPAFMTTGKICEDCGQDYGRGVFIWLPDEVWKQLGYKPTSYVCDICILRRYSQHFSCGFLTPRRNGVSKISKAALYIETKNEHEQMDNTMAWKRLRAV